MSTDMDESGTSMISMTHSDIPVINEVVTEIKKIAIGSTGSFNNDIKQQFQQDSDAGISSPHAVLHSKNSSGLRVMMDNSTMNGDTNSSCADLGEETVTASEGLDLPPTCSSEHIVNSSSAAVCEVGKEPEEVSHSDDTLPPQMNSPTSNGQDEELKHSTNGIPKGSSLPRRVSFHENIVTKIVQGSDPWKRVENRSADDIIQVYKKVCLEDLNIKPSSKIVNEILKASTCSNGERAESFSVKGEKLDKRHCEALEAVFKHARFKFIDLEATNLDDEGATAIFDMLEYYESTQRLNISSNKNISFRGWQACARMLKKSLSLEHLDMQSSSVNEHSLQLMARTFRMPNHLRTLHLDYCNLSGKCMIILMTALKVNSDLKELFLADNKLVPSDGIHLGTFLKANRTLTLLDLRNNHLQDDGVQHLASGLSTQTTGKHGLKVLILWNNKISYVGASHVAKAVMSNTCMITLNLGLNPLTNEGIHQLKPALLQNRTLLRLGLQQVKINCEGAIALAEYIADSRNIQRINISENDVRLAGLMALALSLKHNESLTKLDLDREPKRGANPKDYTEQEKRYLEILGYCERNKRSLVEKEHQAAAAAPVPESAPISDTRKESITLGDANAIVIPGVHKDTGVRENNPSGSDAKSAEKSMSSGVKGVDASAGDGVAAVGSASEHVEGATDFTTAQVSVTPATAATSNTDTTNTPPVPPTRPTGDSGAATTLVAPIPTTDAISAVTGAPVDIPAEHHQLVSPMLGLSGGDNQVASPIVELSGGDNQVASPTVELSGGDNQVASPTVELSGGDSQLASPMVELSGEDNKIVPSTVELISPKVDLPGGENELATVVMESSSGDSQQTLPKADASGGDIALASTTVGLSGGDIALASTTVGLSGGDNSLASTTVGSFGGDDEITSPTVELAGAYNELASPKTGLISGDNELASATLELSGGDSEPTSRTVKLSASDSELSSSQQSPVAADSDNKEDDEEEESDGDDADFIHRTLHIKPTPLSPAPDTDITTDDLYKEFAERC